MNKVFKNIVFCVCVPFYILYAVLRTLITDPKYLGCIIWAGIFRQKVNFYINYYFECGYTNQNYSKTSHFTDIENILVAMWGEFVGGRTSKLSAYSCNNYSSKKPINSVYKLEVSVKKLSRRKLYKRAVDSTVNSQVFLWSAHFKGNFETLKECCDLMDELKYASLYEYDDFIKGSSWPDLLDGLNNKFMNKLNYEFQDIENMSCERFDSNKTFIKRKGETVEFYC